MAATVEEIDYEKMRRCLLNDDVDTFQILYEKFGNKDIIRFNVVYHPNINILAFLIEKDASCINFQTSLGLTPLMCSLMNLRPEYAKLLLEYGANPTIKDNNGCDALFYAKMFGHSEIVEIIESKLLIATKSANKR